MSANVFAFKCTRCGRIHYENGLLLIVYCKGSPGEIHETTACKYIGRVGADGEVET